MMAVWMGDPSRIPLAALRLGGPKTAGESNANQGRVAHGTGGMGVAGGLSVAGPAGANQGPAAILWDREGLAREALAREALAREALAREVLAREALASGGPAREGPAPTRWSAPSRLTTCG